MNIFYELEDNQSKIQNDLTNKEQCFYGKGKLLLTGEYFVLDGAKALALPTKVGQSLKIRFSQSFAPKLHWKSFDYNGNLWMEVIYELWHFDILTENPSAEALWLQKVLRTARKLNSHFIRDNVDLYAESYLGFPLEWGLGSSSTLIYNIAQWAYVSPFALLFETFGGSGYDIACAQSDGPILYEKDGSGPHWQPTYFDPSFSKSLYFIYLGNKQDSREGISFYESKKPFNKKVAGEITKITEQILTLDSLKDFEDLITKHESIIGSALGLSPVKEERFPDFWGAIKSLGAWGGDFILATSDKGARETSDYFKSKGHDVILPYKKLIDKSEKGNSSELLTDSERKNRDNEYIQ